MMLPALQFVREKDVEKRGRALSMFCPEGNQIPTGFEQGLKRALSQLVRMGFISHGDVDRLAREHGSPDGYFHLRICWLSCMLPRCCEWLSNVANIPEGLEQISS
jgi:hypothetical protein